MVSNENRFLKNHPNKIYEVPTMIYKAFVKNTKSTMSFQNVIDHFSNLTKDSLPLTLIAIEKVSV